MSSIKIANRLNGVLGQPMFEYLAKANILEQQGKSFIHLELGDPEFDTPQDAKRWCDEAIRDGYTHYVPSRGMQCLLDASAKVTHRSRGFYPKMEQLLVTPGANIQIYLALAAACNPGDEILIPAPYFPSYVAQTRFVGAVPVIIDSTPENGFKITPDELDPFTNSKTKVLILNSPNNPTGAFYTYNELRDIYSFAQKYNLLIISDEVYSRLLFNDTFCSISAFDLCQDRVVVVNGFSKGHAMSGWRIGVCTGPSKLIEAMRMALETMLSCVPPFIQVACAKVLESNQEEQLEMVRKTKERIEAVLCGLADSTVVSAFNPSGGLYVWAKILNGMLPNDLFASLFDRGLIISPSTIFGYDGYIRIACVKPVAELMKATGIINATRNQ